MNTIIQTLTGMALFCIIIFMHELGHWIIFKLLGFKVGLKLNKLGDLEIGRSVHNKITLWQALPVSIGGIALGLVPFYLGKFFLSQDAVVMFFIVYCFMCFGDLQCIMGILNTKNKKQTMMQFNIGLWNAYVEDMRKVGEKI